MSKLKADMKRAQQITYESYLATGSMLALIDCPNIDRFLVAKELDKIAERYESGAMEIRSLCEKHRPDLYSVVKKPVIPPSTLTGKVDVNEYGWVHICLNTLLPHCRYQTPEFLTDTIIRLLDEYESSKRKLPYFEEAMLIIDEHCDIPSRRIFDQDNKGWKAIPNAIKGRLIDDDDQFSLRIALISTKAEIPACHIHLIHAEESADFFSLHDGYYPGLFR